MKAVLRREPRKIWHFNNAGEQIFERPSGVTGDLSGVTGDLSGVKGDLSGVRGNLTGVWGDLTDCDLSDEDRERGIHIGDLIAPIVPPKEGK